MQRVISQVLELKQVENLTQIIDDVVKSCPQCAIHGRGRQIYAPPKGPQFALPFEYVHIDLMKVIKSKAGYKYVLVVIDYASRFVSLEPLYHKDMVELAQALLEVFCVFGFPQRMKSDNGKEFINRLVAELCKLAKIKHVVTIAYDHHANGIVERCIQTARDSLNKFCGILEYGTMNWEKMLPMVQFGINCRVNEITKRPPFMLMFGRSPFKFNGELCPIFDKESADSRMEFWQKFNELIPKEIYDLRVRASARSSYHHHIGEFAIGDYVMKSREREKEQGKHVAKFEGPYRIVEFLNNGHYKIVSDKGEFEVPANMLKKVKEMPFMTGEYEELDFEIPSQQVEKQDQMVIEDEEQEVIESSNDVVTNQRARAKRATRVNDRVREGMKQLVGVDDLSDDNY